MISFSIIVIIGIISSIIMIIRIISSNWYRHATSHRSTLYKAHPPNEKMVYKRAKKHELMKRPLKSTLAGPTIPATPRYTTTTPSPAVCREASRLRRRPWGRDADGTRMARGRGGTYGDYAAAGTRNADLPLPSGLGSIGVPIHGLVVIPSDQ